ncbi:hypothetical protein [Candidatus Mycolicibacterium alkanivorans]|uniref:Uncharacterized protein n=1 Tax=Candidatus Mycolicibacterium alkanivorans TaxID=2954114 RepID=A0ABS9YXG2_9MYCO|nr:hypothetical protein [Candidatus Mycolicibacterium alkanivorans]MCI4675936.1 hypothetical protein [Candidatus Mycolicibacterium alkanivorans]
MRPILEECRRLDPRRGDQSREFTLWVREAVQLGQLKPGLDVNTLFTNEYNPYANGTYPPGADEGGKNT